MTTIATVCARGGSKGVPGKNKRSLLGRPLIAWTLAQALSVAEIEAVYVSTDDPEIADIARREGAQVPFLRPAELARDETPKLPVIRHLVDHVRAAGVGFTRIVDLDPTSPLRQVEDIRSCLSLLTSDVDVVLTAYPAEKNPYFNMIELVDGGFDLVKRLPIGVSRRQDAPQVYSMNASIYVWWSHTLDRGLFGPRTRLHVMPRERSIDIDTELDFAVVEFLASRR